MWLFTPPSWGLMLAKRRSIYLLARGQGCLWKQQHLCVCVFTWEVCADTCVYRNIGLMSWLVTLRTRSHTNTHTFFYIEIGIPLQCSHPHFAQFVHLRPHHLLPELLACSWTFLLSLCASMRAWQSHKWSSLIKSWRLGSEWSVFWTTSLWFPLYCNYSLPWKAAITWPPAHQTGAAHCQMDGLAYHMRRLNLGWMSQCGV